MKCPVCPDASLAMTDRQGIEIDYCPQCRGVWLDRGELDKLIERAAPQASAAPAQAPARPLDPRHVDPYHHKRYKKKSLLGELFDF